MEYQKINGESLAKLAEIVGQENLKTGTEVLAAYTHDALAPDGTEHYPEAVLLPASAAEIAAIVRLANQKHFPVTPRGAGTGLAGGAVPLYGGVVIDLSRLNKIIKIDAQACYMVVEPGVLTTDIQRVAQKYQLLYAGDPSSDDCVIGGNVATNAGGNRAVKYGVTADQIYELEVVTPQGEIVRLGARLKKNSTGYGLVKLMAGSEGTLGIVTQITLKLYRLATLMTSYLAVFPTLAATFSAVKAILDDFVLDPISLEFIDRKTVVSMIRYRRDWQFTEKIGDLLIIQLEAVHQADLEQKQRLLAAICLAAGGDSRPVVDEQVWEARRHWGKAVKAETTVITNEDIVVPVDQMPVFFTELNHLIESFHLDIRMTGHAGDGNVHLHVTPGSVPKAAWRETVRNFRPKLYDIVYRLGGRISGEHGIGYKRMADLAAVTQPVELALMKSIKQAFDPNHILNPGKIFE